MFVELKLFSEDCITIKRIIGMVKWGVLVGCNWRMTVCRGEFWLRILTKNLKIRKFSLQNSHYKIVHYNDVSTTIFIHISIKNPQKIPLIMTIPETDWISVVPWAINPYPNERSARPYSIFIKNHFLDKNCLPKNVI